MGKWVNILYGAVIGFLALDAMIFGIIPEGFLPLAILVMGTLILITPLGAFSFRRSAPGTPTGYATFHGTPIGARYQWLRRWVFGTFVVLQGLISYGQFFGLSFLETYGARAAIETFSGQIILLVIGAIYFLSSFERTRAIGIGSV